MPHDLSWRELRTFVRHLPRESAYVRSVYGDLADWGVAEHLQATAINDHRIANSGKKTLPESKLVNPPKLLATPAPVESGVNGHDKPGGADDLNALFDGR